VIAFTVWSVEYGVSGPPRVIVERRAERTRKRIAADFVIMFTTPPPKRPYSAEMAPVDTFRLLDRVLDEEIQRLPAQVLVHDDAV